MSLLPWWDDIFVVSRGTIRHDDVVVSVMSDVHSVVLNLHSLGGGRRLTFFKLISLELLEH